mmetsp:Transcript_1612/g.3104  ORF Transcript_1612/g.3104 Transcript_1612/m.3104 type:complete len:98 (-) Transcript_1612:1288-1581(-)
MKHIFPPIITTFFAFSSVSFDFKQQYMTQIGTSIQFARAQHVTHAMHAKKKNTTLSALSFTHWQPKTRIRTIESSQSNPHAAMNEHTSQMPNSRSAT